MSKKTPPPQTNDVPELEDFTRVQQELERQLEPLQPLIEEYNTLLERANAAVRSRGIAVGDFKISREFDEFDADKLFELVGRDKFLEWGGAESTKRILSVDKVKLRSFIAAGKVPKAIVDQVLTHQKQYSTPKPLRLA